MVLLGPTRQRPTFHYTEKITPVARGSSIIDNFKTRETIAPYPIWVAYSGEGGLLTSGRNWFPML
jgi:hypothetical protein